MGKGFIDSVPTPQPRRTRLIAAWTLLLLVALGGCVPSVAEQTAAECPVLLCNPSQSSAPVPPSGPSTPAPTATILPYGRFVIATNFTSSTVSSYLIDGATGLLRPTGYALTGANPSGSAVDPTGRFAYVADYGAGTISGYTFDSLTGGLIPIPGSPFATGGGSQPYGIAFDPFGRFAYVPFQGSSFVAAFSINSTTGALTPFPGSPFAIPGSSARSAVVTPDGRFLYVPDRFNHRLYGFEVDAATPTLTALPSSPVPVSGGTPAPEFLAVAPSGAYLYSANPGNATISGYAIDAATGALTELTGSPFAATAYHGFAIHPSGNYLYGTSGSGVGAHVVNPDGSLAGMAGSPFGAGSGAQWIAVDPTGDFAYVANASSNDVSVMAIAAGTGVPSLVSNFRTQQSPFSVAIAGGMAPVTFMPKFAFVVNQLDTGPTSFTVNPADGSLTQVNTASEPAATFPFGAAVHPSGKFVYAGNLNSYNVSGFSVDPATGTLARLSNSPYPSPNLNPGGVVSVAIDPSGKYLYAVTNNNLLYYFEIDAVTGDLTIVNPPPSGIATGSTPNHVAVDPTGQFLYVTNSGSNDITVYTIDVTSGTPAVVTSTGAGVVGRVSAADPSGRYLYNGAQNSTITAFQIGMDGSLSSMGGIPSTTGVFAIAPGPTGTTVYTGDNTARTVSSFTIDPGGSISLAATYVTSTTPAAIPYGVAVDISDRFVYAVTQGQELIYTYSVNPDHSMNPGPTYATGGSGQPYTILAWGSFQ